MIAYLLPGIDQTVAKRHPAFAALLCAGPWAFRMDPRGALAVWDADGWRDQNAAAFASPRASVHADLQYLGPKVPAKLSALAVPADERSEVVDLGNGQAARILPVRLEPRRLLMGGGVGDPTTEYGTVAWGVFEREKALGEGKALPVVDPGLIRLAFLALRTTHPRLTEDLADDLGVITTENIDRITGAAFAGPKAPPAGAG